MKNVFKRFVKRKKLTIETAINIRILLLSNLKKDKGRQIKNNNAEMWNVLARRTNAEKKMYFFLSKNSNANNKMAIAKLCLNADITNAKCPHKKNKTTDNHGILLYFQINLPKLKKTITLVTAKSN